MKLREEILRKRNLVPIVFCLALLSIFFLQIDFHNLLHSLLRANLFFLLLAFVSHYLAYFFRGKRWERIMRRHGFQGNGLDLAKIIFLFQALDCILPAKIGDLYGAHLMKINYDMNRSYSLGTIFLWRIMDGALIMIVALLGVIYWFRENLPDEIIFSWQRAIILAFLGLSAILLYLFLRKQGEILGTSGRLRNITISFINGLKLERQALPLLISYTLIIWLLEVGRLFSICLSFGLVVELAGIIFTTFIADMATAMPLTPAGVGAVELVMVKLLQIIKIDRSFIFPVIILDRAIAYWSQILLGGLFLILARYLNLKIWAFKEFPYERT